MIRQAILINTLLAASTALATAQATNTFPSNGNVGIGTTSPAVPLDIDGYMHVAGNTSPATTAEGAYLDWNALTGGWGETDLINNQGGGYGGFAFMNIANPGNQRSTLMFINGANGNAGIGTTTPSSRLTVYAGTNNIDPSLSYGSPAAFSFQSAAVELAGGVATTTPWTYWLQARQQNGQAWTMALNPLGGNVGIGTTSPGATLEVDGNVKLTSGSGASITFADGTTQSTAYNGVSCGGDFAESVDVTGQRKSYEAGDLLVIDPKHPGEFQEAAEPYSTLVAGIYSTKPGYVGRRLSGPKSPDEVPLAMVGIVPTKVTAENGPIHTGDLLVASSTPGKAMKGTDRTRLTGAVVGKALGSLDSGTGVVEVLVTLQ